MNNPNTKTNQKDKKMKKTKYIHLLVVHQILTPKHAIFTIKENKFSPCFIFVSVALPFCIVSEVFRRFSMRYKDYLLITVGSKGHFLSET